MDLSYISEPLLQFANDTHVCPRAGISDHIVFDGNKENRRDQVSLAAVGVSENIDLFAKWLDKVKQPISAKESYQPNLFPAFIGFTRETGFRAEFKLHQENVKPILNKELTSVMKSEHKGRIEKAVDLYSEKIRFLAQNRSPDVIICIIPDDLFDLISTDNPKGEEQAEDHLTDVETNFRRMLKAEVMTYSNLPIQLIRENTLKGNPTGKGETQDDATTAWNLCTALYYKSSNVVIPWKLYTDANRPLTCFVGISFYRSRDKRSVFSSLAQIFDEMGRNIILRGTQVDTNKDDRHPFLNGTQANALLMSAIKEYRLAMNTYPARIVIHKTSKYTDDEYSGFAAASKELGIEMLDAVSLSDSNLRILRGRDYPPYRGSLLELGQNRYLLYTRGSVPYFRTYPGKYIPQPLEVEMFATESSSIQVAQEIMALTKMNWNNTQFDRKYPVTIECARNVGKVIKYLKNQDDRALPHYRYYM